MAETIYQDEAIPAAYPISEIGSDAIWQRIEAHVAHRWTPRAVIWIVEGPGEWVPPLAPAEVTTLEVWQAGQWVEVPAVNAPRGIELHAASRYRVTATVGDNATLPEGVGAAFDRLKAYVEADHGGVPGASSYAITTDQLSETIRRDPAFLARAIHNSGAADLLRPYRRA